jgi:hypothetical protein
MKAMSALELAQKSKAARPDIRYAAEADGGSVAGFDEAQGRFVRCAYLGIDGRWYSSPYEILVDGQVPAATWIEV